MQTSFLVGLRLRPWAIVQTTTPHPWSVVIDLAICIARSCRCTLRSRMPSNSWISSVETKHNCWQLMLTSGESSVRKRQQLLPKETSVIFGLIISVVLVLLFNSLISSNVAPLMGLTSWMHTAQADVTRHMHKKHQNMSLTDKRNKKFSKDEAQFTRGQFVRLVQHTEED